MAFKKIKKNKKGHKMVFEGDKRLVTQREMAKLLNISEKTIILWRELGYIPFVDLNRPYYIPDEVYSALRKRQKTKNLKYRGF